MVTSTQKTTKAAAGAKQANAKSTAAKSAGKAASTSAKKATVSSAITAASSNKTSSRKANGNGVTADERYNMIATAAYFRAEQRGFGAGLEMDDWFLGEQQINEMLGA